MRAEAGVRPVRKRRSARVSRGRGRTVRRVSRRAFWALGIVATGLVTAGVVFAGAPARLAEGVTVAGVDVGGLTPEQARAKLRGLSERYASVPVVFTAGERRWSLSPAQLGVRAAWPAALADALERGDGPLPLRGLKRLGIRLFGADVQPPAAVYEAGLEFRLARIGTALDAPAREAAVVLSGLRPVVVPERAGNELDRAAAKKAIVEALVGFERAPVALPVKVDEPAVTEEMLVPVAARVRTALSKPVRLSFRGANVPVRPVELAPLLDLPSDGETRLGIDQRRARRFFENLSRGVMRRPVSADFAVRPNGRVRVVPSRDGRVLNVAATADALLDAALASRRRAAPLVVESVEPRLTTSEARALKLQRRLGSYATLYSGTPDRIQNLQRAVSLLDGALVAPGATFSLNKEVGPRTAERGFRPAPVIVNGEYEEGIGGGVSQVATTVFNAAWEAGLKITSRTAHALYISRYPLGRDATVNYPDIDLKFTNDTGRWILVDAAYDESGIVISLLGGGAVRRVVSEPGELEETVRPKVEREPDPTLFVGQRIVVDPGEPGRAVRVLRTVYRGDAVLYRETWATTYRSEPRIVRVGTKPKPAEPPPPKKDKKKEEEPPPTSPATGG